MTRDATTEMASGMRGVCKPCSWTGAIQRDDQKAVADRDEHNKRYHPRGGRRCDVCRCQPAKIIPTMRRGMSDEPGILCAKCDKKTKIDAEVGLKALFG